MIELKVEENILLSKLLLNQKGMTFGKFKSLLKKKDIKVNDKKINKDLTLYMGDFVRVYGFNSELKNNIPIVYQDNNILIINKPSKLQVQKKDVEDNHLCVQDYFPNTFCVHRLDRNTSGLLVLAKTKESEKILVEAFKKRQVDKFYKTLVFGEFNTENKIYKGYILKNKNTGISKVFDKFVENSEEIKTGFSTLKLFKGFSLLEVKLLTGKTHQIRAHLNFLNHSIVGDSKYQNIEYSSLNKNLSKFVKNQCLIAYKLKFNFDKNSFLAYLNEKTFEIEANFNFPFLVEIN